MSLKTQLNSQELSLSLLYQYQFSDKIRNLFQNFVHFDIVNDSHEITFCVRKRTQYSVCVFF